jgi:hypothetical protein
MQDGRFHCVNDGCDSDWHEELMVARAARREWTATCTCGQVVGIRLRSGGWVPHGVVVVFPDVMPEPTAGG